LIFGNLLTITVRFGKIITRFVVITAMHQNVMMKRSRVVSRPFLFSKYHSKSTDVQKMSKNLFSRNLNVNAVYKHVSHENVQEIWTLFQNLDIFSKILDVKNVVIMQCYVIYVQYVHIKYITIRDARDIHIHM